VGTYLPAVVPQPVKMVECCDGYTVDETGLLGRMPGMDGVVVAIGFSGDGFKMASSLGAVVADLIPEGTSTTDIGFRDPARFLAPQRTVAAVPLDGAATYQELL
jgi:sarcosine oxidase